MNFVDEFFFFFFMNEEERRKRTFFSLKFSYNTSLLGKKYISIIFCSIKDATLTISLPNMFIFDKQPNSIYIIYTIATRERSPIQIHIFLHLEYNT